MQVNSGVVALGIALSQGVSPTDWVNQSNEFVLQVVLPARAPITAKAMSKIL